jgi:hypothetical protein
MRTSLFAPVIVCMACLLVSCTSPRECTSTDTYHIEYITGGGFTGFEQGTSVECSGWVTMWERAPGKDRVMKDSVLLRSSARTRIDALVNDPAVFAYAHQEPANHTATLTIVRGTQSTRVSYPSTSVPADLPASMRALVNEITSIQK